MNVKSSRAHFVSALAALPLGASLAARTQALGATLPLIQVANGVSYVPGDIEGKLTCNTGVIEGRDGLTLVDAALPSGAAAALQAIRAHNQKPLVRVIDTHYHLDHTYGNAFWHDHGAKPVAFEGMRAELRKAEPELFGGGPGLYEQMSAKIPSLRSSRPLAPAFVAGGTAFEEGPRKFTLMHPGVAHTHSDAVVWLAEERVLFTGDLVANGPYNAVADSTIGSWIHVLDRLKALSPAVVIPGHGPAGGPELIARQRAYFERVTALVRDAAAGGGDVASAIPNIHAALKSDSRYSLFVNDHHLPYSAFFALRDLVGKIYHEQTGRTLALAAGSPPAARCCGDLLRRRV